MWLVSCGHTHRETLTTHSLHSLAACIALVSCVKGVAVCVCVVCGWMDAIYDGSVAWCVHRYTEG